jgi:hypothetical protein
MLSPSSTAESDLPIHLAFLRRVNLRQFDAFVVEKDLHVIEQELMRVGVGHVEAKVVNKLFLLFLPRGPAILANLSADLLPEFRRYRRVAERFIFLPATFAFEFVTK